MVESTRRMEVATGRFGYYIHKYNDVSVLYVASVSSSVLYHNI